jgi:hypothetical protein
MEGKSYIAYHGVQFVWRDPVPVGLLDTHRSPLGLVY